MNHNDSGPNHLAYLANLLAAAQIVVGVPKAARLLDISERTLSDYTARGLIPVIKPAGSGGRVLYSVDALRAWAMQESKLLVNENAAVGQEISNEK